LDRGEVSILSLTLKVIMDDVEKAAIMGQTSIDLTNRLLSHIVLGWPLRDYFMKVKGLLNDALRKLTEQHIQQRIEGKEIDETTLAKTIMQITKVLPMPTEKNSDAVNAHTIKRIEERFFRYSKFRRHLFLSAFRLIKFELGHDIAYDDALQILIEEIIKEILRGNWKVRHEEPLALYWDAQTPKGGKYSIISILQDKKALENLLGDDWRLKEEK